MPIEKQIEEAKKRLRDWWEDPIALGRPVVLCNCEIEGTKPKKHWEYFTYANMLIKMLGNDELRPRLREALLSSYRNIPALPKAPTGIKVDFQAPEYAEIMVKVQNQVDSMVASSPHADAIPILRSQSGPGFPVSCLGEYSSLPTTGPDTIWFDTVRRWPELEHLELDRTSPWWQVTMEVTRRQLEIAPSWVAVGFPSMNGTTDMLQSLRGTTNFIRDMMKEKDLVKKALDQVQVAFQETVDAFWGEIKKKREGSGSFIGVWAPGNAPSVQCDALAYIGPRQFKQFALPYITADLENADYGTYHLDGPGAIKFLHDLLEIPGLDLIQWVEGAGNPDGVALQWYPLVRKVLEAGKRIILYTSVDRVPHFMRRLKKDGVDPRGVCFSLGNVAYFEVEEFLPWLEADPGCWEKQQWYGDEFWDEYYEIQQDDPDRYADLENSSENIQLDYK
ncbi:MAG: hypothetical protein ACFFCS_02575 [Candidatus Hodarchaeota archaeon]